MVSVEAIREFVSVVIDSYGDCYSGGDSGGSGYGRGYGDCYSGSDCSGYGGGRGGSGGYGRGGGSGDSNSSGDIKTINGLHTAIIDNILTAITNIRGNVAKGYIVNVDLTLEPCYVVKQDNLFSHGKSVKNAMSGLRDKLFEEMSEEERIDMFWEEHNLESDYPAQDLYEWHNKLTGSCEFGRQSFCKNHNINLNKDKFTVKQFVELCRNDYGGEVISKLLRRNK